PPKSRCHRGAVGSPREAWGSRSNLELRSEGSPYLSPRSQLAATGFAWQLLPCEDPDSQSRSCAGMRWSVPEMGTNLGTNSTEGELRLGQRAENNGGQGRDGTADTRIFSPVLYQLSYLPTTK